MTKEKLKQEAKEYVCKRNPLVTKEWFIDALKKYDKGEKVKYLTDCEIAEYEAYLAGAEPREKQIRIDAEQIRALQKQNGELTDKVKELEAQLEREKNLNQCLSDHNEQLRELEKENAELREKYDTCLRENTELKSGCGMCYRKDKENLTKAKEIIKYLLSFIQKENYKTRWDINITEAEQFLKEVEK